MGATMQDLDFSKINLGPCKVTFGGVELGRTEGDTKFIFTTEYTTGSTEEDGEIMDIVINHTGELEIPLVYTDPKSISVTMPWARLTENTTSGEAKLEVGSAIGTVMNDYAGKLIIHPLAKDDDDLSADITLGSAYPLPQTLELTHSREGKRMNNTNFKAQKDADGNYFTIGDPSLTSA